jgi:hypothetical protein
MNNDQQESLLSHMEKLTVAQAERHWFAVEARIEHSTIRPAVIRFKYQVRQLYA